MNLTAYIKPILLIAATLLFAASPAPLLAQSADEATVTDGNATAAETESFDADFLKPVTHAARKLRDVDPALWVIRDEDTTIYLFGTVHILKPGLGWFDEAVKDAFDKSDSLVVEVVEGSAAEMQTLFGKYALAEDGIVLRKRLSGEHLENYLKAMKDVGLEPNSFDALDPWAAAVSLQLSKLVADGFDPNSGVETILEAEAKANGKKIDQVETIDDQLGAFDNISMPAQLKLLNDTTANFDATTPELEKLIEHWAEGNTDELAQLVAAGFRDEDVFRALLLNRNAQWAAWVRQRLQKPGTVFMAVGAGHLAGSVSLQNMLLPYGIETKRIDY